MEQCDWATLRGEEYSLMTWRVDGLHLIVNGCVDCMLACEWMVWDCNDSEDSLKFVE